jgi:SAM-dependent methyltransferase
MSTKHCDNDAALARALEALAGSVREGSLVKCTFGAYAGADATLQNVYARMVVIKGVPQLSCTYRHTTKDVVKNVPLAQAVDAARALLTTGFRALHLFTTGFDLELRLGAKGIARLTRRAPQFTAVPSPDHDHAKQRLIPPDAPWLRDLGITNEQGRVIPRMADKFRQIERFAEILAPLLDAPALRERSTLRVHDMGCGKGYLTFAVYALLCARAGVTPQVRGIEARAELVDACAAIVRRHGYAGLEFCQGQINACDATGADVVMALHACDTATDDALAKAVKAGATLVICAPCCHKEVRPQLEPPAMLQGVLRHGILRERMAELLTDGLRALLLEAHGYSTKVFEFIATEHTQKNIMLVGERRAGSSASCADAERQIVALKEFFGIRALRLEELLHMNNPAGPRCPV